MTTSLTPSGFPLHTLEVKAGAPLMLLHNLNPLEGLYNGTYIILLSWTTCVLRRHILRHGVNEAHLDNQNTVLIPHMTLDATSEDNPIPLRR